MTRIVSWFSCGAASAVATKLAIEAGRGPVEVVRCWIAEEHPDNDRFAEQCAKWFGVPILTLKNEEYAGSVYEVIRKRNYLNGPNGAPCTVKLKKDVRKAYQRLSDVQVFGYTVDEQERYDRFLDSNNDVQSWPVLIEAGLTHAECLHLVSSAGIKLPEMYALGYKHNNCIGCVKGGAGYWNKIRVDFPEAYQSMSVEERRLNHPLIRVTRKGVRIPVFLDELDPSAGDYPTEPEIQCGINCELTELMGFAPYKL